jgi:ParB-like chromosome segregation protein Spo0J
MAIASRAAIHKATAAVREMNSDEFSSLMDSMRTVGQLTPIYTYRGEVIDGRAKLRACQRLRIEPIIEKIDPNLDPLDVVDALNLRRRHLTTSELAMAASRLNRRTPEDLATIGISKRSVEHADKVHRDGAPETIDAASRGEIPVSLASRISDLPKQHQADKVQKIQAGKKPEVIAELNAIKPVRKQAVDERPSVIYREETQQPSAAEAFEVVKRCSDPMEVARLMVTEFFKDYQIEIVRRFIPAIETPQTSRFEQDNYDAQMAALYGDDEIESEESPEVAAELVDLETIEIIRDRVSDEMIQSPQMVGLGGRLKSLATAVGAVRLLFAATEKHAPRGDIGKLSDPAITTACGFTGNASNFISAMVQEGFLQRDVEHRLLVTDWPNLCLPEMAEELCGIGEGFAEPTGIPKFKEPKARAVKNEPEPDYPEAFLEFWNASPKRVNKPDSLEEWQKAVSRIEPQDGLEPVQWLLARWREYAKSWLGKTYPKSPDLWLKGQRYDDGPGAWDRFNKETEQNEKWTDNLRRPPKPLLLQN